ncbi:MULTISPECIES: barstar family protein [Amycolatopsis]|uniref:Barstar (Barnase inhibitor) n=2 Tax=Amycolatopsis TaxID=1813 RepID=A0A1I3XKC7_9PSEU|nr:barstar family protein [Amycolatopsis sacchari]SFK19955.1 Barstar (barnase inhibitor) [Amycolatopsis sacchari]
MAPFDPQADLNQEVDFRLLINTPITLFWRREVLDEAIAWLQAHGYQVTRLDAARWTTEADFHRAIAQTPAFPDYYGHNLAALHDAMQDVVAQDYGWAPETTGLALVFAGYDKFTDHCGQTAQAVLDIIATHSRVAALFGRRLMGLVQSDDPAIRFEPVGASPVSWNDAEWPDSRRRIP